MKLNLARLGTLATAGALAILGTFASFAAPAGASTTACHNSGAFAGFCGSQTNGNNLNINVKQNVAASGQAVIGYSAAVVTPGSDFIWQPDAILGGGTKKAVYAPNGVPAISHGQNLCLSAPGQAGAPAVQLRYCNNGTDNTGNKFQGWTWDATTKAWINANSGQAISQSTTTGNLLTMVTAPTTEAPATAWTFNQ